MAKNLIDLVREAGVVGAGGAGFPTHVKLQSKNIDTVIANGVECEPLLQVDRLMMIRHADAIMRGLLAVKEALGAKEAVIAVKKKNTDAVHALESVLQPGVRIHLLEDIYPMGDEQVLIYEVTGRVVPPAGLPLDVGVVVSNVSTLYQVCEASCDLPFTHRFVTITGYVHKPMTVKVPIGMSIKEVIALAGGPTVNDYRVINGGPMMGQLVSDLHQPITKVMSGLIVLPPEHPVVVEREIPIEQMIRRAKSVCCRCEGCSEVCPRGLLGHGLKPHLVMRAVSHNLADPALAQAYLCSECGLCVYGCTMGLSPRKINQAVKQELRKAGVKNTPDKSKVKPHEMRSCRQIPGKRLQGRFQLTDLPAHAPYDETVVLPNRVQIPLRQHTGAPAEPVVTVGAEVKAGQLIGQIPAGSLGAAIHASIDGKVVKIDEFVHIEGS